MNRAISITYEQRIAAILNDLGLKLSKFPKLNLLLYNEESNLQYVGTNIYKRKQFLRHDSAKKWFYLQNCACEQGIKILLISAFRSVNYQKEIWERKIASGKKVQQIIYNNVPPGFSEHHTGCAIDVTTESSPPLTTDFESTLAYTWLHENADQFGLTMTYPRNNKCGINYEPWHWCFQV